MWKQFQAEGVRLLFAARKAFIAKTDVFTHLLPLASVHEKDSEQ